ncbi:MAG: hypothetical protein AAF492_26765, partial [Verrucomicrobiota bacterium]
SSTNDDEPSTQHVLNFTYRVDGGKSQASPVVVEAGSEQKVLLPGSIQVKGTVSKPGAPVRWEQTYGPERLILGSPGQLATTVSGKAAGLYGLRLTSGGASDELVLCLGYPVCAGNDVTLARKSRLFLSGRVTEAAFPDLDLTDDVRYEWKLLSGPGTATIKDATRRLTSVKFSEVGSYKLRFSAQSKAGNFQDDLAVLVR